MYLSSVPLFVTAPVLFEKEKDKSPSVSVRLSFQEVFSKLFSEPVPFSIAWRKAENAALLFPPGVLGDIPIENHLPLVGFQKNIIVILVKRSLFCGIVRTSPVCALTPL